VCFNGSSFTLVDSKDQSDLAVPEEILQQYWGYKSFRPLQRDIINSVLEGKDTLALLPTGGGKSLCYQVPAIINPGICIVVSPLIALMQDQVSRLEQLEIPAACIHSGMHYNEVKEMLAHAVEGDYKMLYVSPERLQTRVFNDYLQEMEVTMIAVDEAHCISQWGHDFRPAYLQIASVRDVFPNAPVLALTATATREVQDDIGERLRMTAPARFKMSFSRSNIFYEVKYSDHKGEDALTRLGNDCSIVYCRSRRQTETSAMSLDAEGLSAAVYHAGLTRELRDKAQAAWMSNEAHVMVATTAFGMGIDKPDVRTVIHLDAPEHPEAYYQEAGRAGRDGLQSVATALYNSSDIRRLRESTAILFPPDAYLRQVYQSVAEYLQVPISAQPDRYFPFDLADFCTKFRLQAMHAIYALKLLEREGLWTLTDSVYRPATVRFVADRHTLDDLSYINAHLSYVAIGLLRMYNSIFHYPVAVRETAIARQLKMKKDDVIKALEQLAAMEMLEYSRPGEGPQLFFHHYRVDSRHLNINHKRINLLRKRHIERTEAMIAYLEDTTTCREQMLLRYFGENTENRCGHCDNCRNEAQKPLDVAQFKADLLTRLGQQISVDANSLISNYTHNQREAVVQLIRSMIDRGEINVENGQLRL
jgi:ATP-dependent DNA helicase RecQ